MAGIFADVDSDIKKLQRLKAEIESVKKALTKINVNVEIDIAKGMEAQLKSLMGQYDGLIKKIAEAEGKILLSTKKINDASEKIISAQERLSKASGLKSQEDGNIGGNSAQIASIDAQAKAYNELKIEIESIIGTRSQNIKRMVEEQNAIRLINAEIRQITKTQGQSAVLSKSQQQRLEQLNNSLLTHKTALAEVRQNLRNNAKLDNVAATSMNGLSQSLQRMRITYRELTEEERNSPFGKELLSSIQQADTKIKQLDATIGNHQRNVGNYASGWNGLSMSIQQIGRELPSLAVGWNTFFLAISNNLPTLADEIKRAKVQYNELKDSGQKAVPVWKQVVSSIFSWQSALTVGITLLTLYGDKLVDWVDSLFTAKKALSETYQSLEDYQKKVGETSGSVISTLERLSQGWKRLGGDIDAQKKFILENKDAIDSMGVSVNDAAEAERLFNTNKGTFIKGLLQRAKAAATMELAAEEYKKAVQKMMEADAKSAEGVSFGDRLKSWFVKSAAGEDLSGTLQKADLSPEAFAKEKEENMRKEAESLFKSGTELVMKYVQFSEEERKTLESIGIKTTQTMINGSIEAIEAAISLKQQALKKVTDHKEYKRIEAEIRVEQSKLKAITGVKDINTYTDQIYRISELERKQSLERQRQQQDLDNQLEQSRIDSLQDGYEKEQAQRELNNKKEIQALERQKEDYIRAYIQGQKEIFDAQEELKAKQTKGYVRQTFDASTVNVKDITSAWDKIIKNTQIGQGVDEWQKRENAMNEYLIEYGTFSQKKAAIDKKYEDAINKETDLGTKNTLQKQWEEAISSLNMSKLKEEINWEMVFGDLSKITKEQLTKIKAQLQEFKDSDDFKDATPEQIQVIEGAINSINSAMVDKGGIFGGMTESLKELANATEELKKAEEELVRANNEGTEAEKEEAQRKVNKAQQRKQNAETDVTRSSKKTIDNLIMVGDAIAQLGSDAEMSLSSFGNAAASVVDAFTEAGSKIGGIVGAIFSILEGIQKQGLAGFVGNIVGNVAGAVGGIFDTLTFGAFGLGGADYSRYNEMVEEYNKLNEIWDELIDKKREYIDMSYGVEADKVGQEAIDLVEKQIEAYRTLGKERLNSGASVGSHSIGKRMAKNTSSSDWQDIANALDMSVNAAKEFIGTGRMTGLFDLTVEQLEKLKSDAPTFWADMDDDVREYLDSIIEGEAKIEEIQNQVKEQLTQTTFDSVFDSFVDTLMDMDSSAKDFAEDFSEYMQRAILTNMVGEKFSKELQDWYDSFAEAGKDKEGITKGDMEELRKQYEEIVDAAVAERDKLAEIFGWTGEATQQSASSRGFQSMSQDTGEELNGRFTALQIAGEEIKNQNIAQSQSLSILNTRIDTISSTSSNIRDIASETRDIIANSYLELVQISENTGAIVKPVQQMQKDIAEVKKNTSKL